MATNTTTGVFSNNMPCQDFPAVGLDQYLNSMVFSANLAKIPLAPPKTFRSSYRFYAFDHTQQKARQLLKSHHDKFYLLVDGTRFLQAFHDLHTPHDQVSDPFRDEENYCEAFFDYMVHCVFPPALQGPHSRSLVVKIFVPGVGHPVLFPPTSKSCAVGAGCGPSNFYRFSVPLFVKHLRELLRTRLMKSQLLAGDVTVSLTTPSEEIMTEAWTLLRRERTARVVVIGEPLNLFFFPSELAWREWGFYHTPDPLHEIYYCWSRLHFLVWESHRYSCKSTHRALILLHDDRPFFVNSEPSKSHDGSMVQSVPMGGLCFTNFHLVGQNDLLVHLSRRLDRPFEFPFDTLFELSPQEQEWCLRTLFHSLAGLSMASAMFLGMSTVPGSNWFLLHASWMVPHVSPSLLPTWVDHRVRHPNRFLESLFHFLWWAAILQTETLATALPHSLIAEWVRVMDLSTHQQLCSLMVGPLETCSSSQTEFHSLFRRSSMSQLLREFRDFSCPLTIFLSAIHWCVSLKSSSPLSLLQLSVLRTWMGVAPALGGWHFEQLDRHLQLAIQQWPLHKSPPPPHKRRTWRLISQRWILTAALSFFQSQASPTQQPFLLQLRHLCAPAFQQKRDRKKALQPETQKERNENDQPDQISPVLVPPSCSRLVCDLIQIWQSLLRDLYLLLIFQMPHIHPFPFSRFFLFPFLQRRQKKKRDRRNRQTQTKDKSVVSLSDFLPPSLATNCP